MKDGDRNSSDDGVTRDDCYATDLGNCSNTFIGKDFVRSYANALFP